MARQDVKVRVTAERVREVFSYDPLSGALTYRVRRKHYRPGERAGFVALKSNHRSGGYRIVRLDNREYAEHWLVWIHTHGRWPTGVLDHMNGDRADNRIANLRDCSVSQNNANRGKQANNTSGIKGVFFNRNARKWSSSINCRRRFYYLGLFKTADEAAAAYARKAKELFGEFARLA